MSLHSDFSRLNEQQKAVVTGFRGPALITAGPGTGKTRTIAVLIGKLLEEGLRFKNLLALTFSDKAAGELRERVFSYYPHSFDECWISTFHSFCARLLREQFHLVSIRPDFRLLTSFKEAVLMDGICRSLDPKEFPTFGRVLRHRGFQLETLTFIGLLKSNLVDVIDLDQMLTVSDEFDDRSHSRLKELSSLYHAYEHERTRLGYLDFRDLIGLSIRVLRDPIVAKAYRNKFKVVLVDEFQDTDPAQFLLLTLLTGENMAGRGSVPSSAGSDTTSTVVSQTKLRVAVVGDPRQSIYRFRGADPHMMDPDGPFRKKFRAKIFSLTRNYRSVPVISAVAARLRWLQKGGGESSVLPDSVVWPDDRSSRDGFIERYEASDELAEARLLARRIASLIIYGNSPSESVIQDENVGKESVPTTIRRYRPDEIAVLVRNNYQVDLISESLRALNIPFAIGGDMKFFRSEEVGTLVSLLKAATLPDIDGDDALRRAFRSPFFGIDPLWAQTVLTGLGQAGRLWSLLEPLADGVPDGSNSKFPEAAAGVFEHVAAFASTMRMLRMEANAPLGMVAARLLLIARDWILDPESVVTRNVLHFRAFLADFDEVFLRLHGHAALLSDLTPDFDALLTYYASTLEESGESGSTGGGPEGVRLMTIHQSKGLEFPVVIIPGLCENQFPVAVRENLLIGAKGLEAIRQACDKLERPIPFFNPYPTGREDHIEEERRLFFVAVTRAQEGLIVSRSCRLSGESSIAAPFLDEIGINPSSGGVDERRVLSIGELRVKLAELTSGDRESLRDVLAPLEDSLGERHLIEPRCFGQPLINAVRLPETYRFSAAAIRDYLDCPRRFFFKRLLRLPDAPERDNLHLLRGQAQHAVLEELHKPGGVWECGRNPAIEEIEELWRLKGETLLAGMGKLQRLTIAHEAMEAFFNYRCAVYELGQLPARNTIGVEQAFEFTFRGFSCIGRYDRLVKAEDGLWVIDYKTGKSVSGEGMLKKAFPEDGNVPDEVQLPFYLLAVRETLQKPCCAMTFYVNDQPYKVRRKEMQSGFLKGASLNFGAGPEWGIEVGTQAFDEFCNHMETVMREIMKEATFDCRPSIRKTATTCLQKTGMTKCEFQPFCQERLEELKLSVGKVDDTDDDDLPGVET
ncbi:MAG: ATP-dependent helicase [Candidatus Riflebacteria bacterium]|nr:ATP-dependent helicase [Candidatus Riflebacteria bacterium]